MTRIEQVEINGEIKEFHVAEWKDVEPLIDKHLIEFKELYAALARF